MPYVFGVLVLLNALMLGYYIFVAPSRQSVDPIENKVELTQPIEFVNSSQYVPPLIGSKD